MLEQPSDGCLRKLGMDLEMAELNPVRFSMTPGVSESKSDWQK